MNRQLFILAVGLVLGLGATLVASGASVPDPGSVPFDDLSLTIEINATDLDAGVLFSSDTGESLEHLTIEDPGGNVVFRLQASDPQDLGLTEVFWESSEPDLQTALLAYPEGAYQVTGTAFDGTVVSGTADLTHDTAAAPVVLSPEEGAEVNLHRVLVAWEPDPDTERHWIELDADDFNFTIPVPEGARSFRIPSVFLQRGTEYKIGLGAVNEQGNAIVTEVEFETK